MGTIAGQVLLRRLAGADGNNQSEQIMIEPELIVRDSTSPVATNQNPRRAWAKPINELEMEAP